MLQRKINRHIIHCSDSTFGDAATIDKWHKERGFNQIGYHFVIKRDGTLESGRPLEVLGAHVRGHNRDSIGTCLIGVDTFTKAQFLTLRNLQLVLKQLFPYMETYPHNYFDSNKTCPNFDIKEVLTDLL